MNKSVAYQKNCTLLSSSPQKTRHPNIIPKTDTVGHKPAASRLFRKRCLRTSSELRRRSLETIVQKKKPQETAQT